MVLYAAGADYRRACPYLVGDAAGRRRPAVGHAPHDRAARIAVSCRDRLAPDTGLIVDGGRLA